MIQIDKDKCNGCGLCAQACHEGAIGMVGGKAELLRDDYCDGLGDCLPVCPTGAITFVSREAAAYDEAAVKASLRAKPLACGYPGTHAKALEKRTRPQKQGLHSRYPHSWDSGRCRLSLSRRTRRISMTHICWLRPTAAHTPLRISTGPLSAAKSR